MAHHSNAKGVAWVALIVALIALVFSWIAFNETGPSLDQRVEDEVQEALETTPQVPQTDNQPATTTEQPDPEPTTPDTEATPTAPTNEAS